MGCTTSEHPGVYTDLAALLALRGHKTALTAGHRKPRSTQTGTRLSRQRGRGLSFEELRHYRPGDDCRLLDWKATRRCGHPMVRVFAEERERPVWLLVDQRSTMFFGSQQRMKSVFAAEIAALIAWHTQASGDRVGAVLFGDEEITPLRPQRTQRQLLQLLNQLADYNQRLTSGQPPVPTKLAEALHEAFALIAHDARIYLVSDLTGWDEQCLALLGALRRHNEVVVVHVTDPLERELPPSGSWRFADHSGGLTVDTLQSAIQQRYCNLSSQLQKALSDTLKRQGIGYFLRDCQIEPRHAWRELAGATGLERGL